MTQKKKNHKILFILLAVMAVAIALLVLKQKSKPKGKLVDIETVSKRTILETVSASGRIFPETEIKISSDVSGEIVELYVEEGDSVVMGQVIARIDPDNFISQVDRGRAGVDGAKAQLAIARANIESSKAQMEQINAQLENARSIHNRNINLKKDGVISELEFEQSLANLRGLEANLRASEASIKSAEQSEQAALFSLKTSEASLKELQTNLRRTTILAPTSGIVSTLLVEKGERVVGTIQMTGTEMMRISDLSNMEVQVEVSESDITKVSIGDKVDIKVDAYLNKKFQGTVTKIANSASNINAMGSQGLNLSQVTNFTIKIRIEPESYADIVSKGKKYPFRPGMTASVDIYTASAEDVLCVPIQAVTIREKNEDMDRSRRLTEEDYEEVVFVFQQDTVTRKTVNTGIQDDEFIEIKSGLTGMEEVITGPYSEISSGLKKGDRVRRKEN
jgi:HlyD family secretion protein